MKFFVKHIILSFILVAYSLFIFGPSVEVVSINQHEKTESVGESYYLTEISKVLFPQTVNSEIGIITAIHIGGQTTNYLEKSFHAIQELNKRLFRVGVNYLKESISIDLQYPPQDIIFPFHDFW